jgi:ABC-type oligopeptide transport system ATPase subunit
MSAPQSVIEVEGLVKSYPTGFWRRRVRVLDDVSFTVGENEIVGSLGERRREDDDDQDP